MSLETKKVVWTTLSVGIVIALAFGICFAAFYPRSASPVPASFMASVPSRTTSPDSYVRNLEPAPAPAPSGDADPDTTTNFVFNYGDRPPEDSLPSGSGSGNPDISVHVGETGLPGTPPGSAPGESSPAQSAPKAKPYTPAPSLPSRVPAAAQDKTAKSASTAAKAATPKSVSLAEYWLQAASFATRSRADDLQRTLAQKGLSSVISVKDIDGKSYYRVRIGPYMRKGDADGWLPKVKGLAGCEEAYVAKQVVQR